MRLILICLFFISSCKPNNKEILPPNKLNELKTFIQSHLENGTTLDSLVFIKLDTVTLWKKYFGIQSRLEAQKEPLLNKMKILEESMENNLKMLRLTRELGSGSLFENAKADAALDRKQFDQVRQQYLEIDNKIKKIDSLMVTADSTKPIDYFAKCLEQLRHKDQSIERDTIYIIMNKDLNIINGNDYYKY